MLASHSRLLGLYKGLSTTEIGRLFERLARKILAELHPYWSQRLIEVVPWEEYARRNDQPEKDTGIDLVAYDRDGGLWAIQVKYWQKPVSWNDLGSFVGNLSAYGLQRGLLIAPAGVTAEAESKLMQVGVTVLTEEALLGGVDLESIDPRAPETIRRTPPARLRPYQMEAVKQVVTGLGAEGSRGKLVMPPGTGKTLVALRVAEDLVGKGGTVVFLAPSIALLDQSIRAWENDAQLFLRIFAVVSDARVGEVEDALDRLSLLHVPPTTNARQLAEAASRPAPDALTVIFSTYQSAEVLEEAQKEYGLGPFNLVIMDEAHRTATVRGEGESPFTKVHHDAYIRAQRRLYMTATPRVWEVSDKVRARGSRKTRWSELADLGFAYGEDTGIELLIYSMDDEAVYGPTLYEYTFTRAVQEGFLTDYKVVVLAMTEDAQKELAEYLQGEQALPVEEALKAVGLWKVLQGEVHDESGAPLHLNIRRAIVFHSRVKDSKNLERELARVAQAAAEGGLIEGNPRRVQIRHIDGQMSAYDRKFLLDWLRGDPEPGEINVLTNAKVLTEGIDVPALDAVAFMRPRDSVVDVVQAVGRAMRRARGKTYGYVVLPVVVRGEDEEREIEESGYRTVWQVLSALRSVDKSFEAKSRAALVSLSGKRNGGTKDPSNQGDEGVVGLMGSDTTSTVLIDVLLTDDALRQKVTRAVAGKLVRRLGMGRKYLETWAEDVARAADRLQKQVRAVTEKSPAARAKLEELLGALRTFVNESINEDDAILMLVQHALTKPVFDALFSELEARRQDPVSKALEALFQEFRAFLERETEALQGFYEEMRLRAQGLVDEAERTDFLRRLYDGFFSRAFKDVADQMGIAYTPVELVDYLVKSADELAQKHFGRGLAAPGVYVLEPFAGTGTFVTRLLHLLGREGARKKLERKEVWANEILLLPYHILKANVESAYLSLTGEYRPFEGALLADSFRLAELFYQKGAVPAIPLFPPEYSALLNRQIEDPIQVVLSNPPWRAGKEREGKGKRNTFYPHVWKRVEETYASKYWELSSRRGAAKGDSLRTLYDLYIQALRMASDRIGDEGIIAFATNNGWLKAKSARGLRACLTEEFAEVYVYDLRGNARTKGELRKKEAGNVFGQASRAGVSMLLLVKKKDHQGPGKVFRYRVGDYLSREEKLALVKAHGSASGTPWEGVSFEDWLGQQSEMFQGMISLEEIFDMKSLGIGTNRDAYAFNFSREELERHMRRLIETFNRHVERAKRGEITKENLEEAIEKDESLIKWSSSLKPKVLQGRTYTFEEAGRPYRAQYRPFVPMWLYFSEVFNHRVGQLPRIWPTPEAKNLAIAVAGVGSQGFSAMATCQIPSLDFISRTQLFPLYTYDPKGDLGFEVARRYNIRPVALARFRERFGGKVTPEDVFHYVYAVLSHPKYAEHFAEDLRNELPRVPLPEGSEDFWALAEAGRTLLELHTGYERLEPWPLEVEEHPGAPEDPYERYRIERLRLNRNKRELRYNDWITIRDLPEATFQWQPGGYSPLEWIERFFQVKEKVKGPPERRIVWDPNQPLREKGDPRYLLGHIGKAVRVSAETWRIFDRIADAVDRVQDGGLR